MKYANHCSELIVTVILILFLLSTGVHAKKNTHLDAGKKKTTSDAAVKSSNIIVKKVVTPNLAGKTQKKAVAVLKEQGLKIGKINFVRSGKAKNGTVIKQSPKAKTKVSVGSAVHIWVLKSNSTTAKGRRPIYSPQKPDKSIKPKLSKKGKKIWLEFPKQVKNIRIQDKNGKVLKRFTKGRRFDVSKLLKTGQTKKVKVTFAPLQNFRGKPVSRKKTPKSSPPPLPKPGFKNIVYEVWMDIAAIWLERYANLCMETSPIEAGEPNNRITSATKMDLTESGWWYCGRVGTPDGNSSDPVDWVKLVGYGSSGNVCGTLITIKTTSRIEITLYTGEQNERVKFTGGNGWVALANDTPIYLKITGAGVETDYRILFKGKKLVDRQEPNNYTSTAKNIPVGVPISAGLLANVMNESGRSTEGFDYFKFVPTEGFPRISIRNAHPPTGMLLHLNLIAKNRRDGHTKQYGGVLNEDGNVEFLFDDYIGEIENIEDYNWTLGVFTHSHMYRAWGAEPSPPLRYTSGEYTLTVE